MPLGSTYFRLNKSDTLTAPKSILQRSDKIEKYSNQPIILAKSGKVEIQLPFPQEELTLVAFHQANSKDVKELTPMGRERKTVLPSRAYNFVRRQFSSSNPLIYVKLIRPGRPGNSNRAIDIGTKAGTKVYAPVSGKVTSVKVYR